MKSVKPVLWVIIIAVVLCALFAIFFLTDLTGSAAIPAEEVEWAEIPAVMVDGVLYVTAGERPTPVIGEYVLDGEITSVVSGSELPTENDQSNFGTGYGYRYGAMEGTLDVLINGEWELYAIPELQQQIGFPRVPAIGVFFAANTSLQEEIVLTKGQPFWRITVENKGTEAINVEIGGTVYRVEAASSATIGTDTMWEPGTYTVSFATAGSSGMVGSATCVISGMQQETSGAVVVKDP